MINTEYMLAIDIAIGEDYSNISSYRCGGKEVMKITEYNTIRFIERN